MPSPCSTRSRTLRRRGPPSHRSASSCETRCSESGDPGMGGLMARVAVNGLGRIGRAFLKLALTRSELEVVAVNDLADPESLAYLMRFDSVYRRYDRPVMIERQGDDAVLVVDGRRLPLLREHDPAKLPWGALRVDIAVEATGAFATYEKARAHLKAGARHVVLTAPAKDEDQGDARTVLVGVNLDALKVCTLSSNGSCTTNSASPVMQILHEKLGVAKAILNTVHGYTASQSLDRIQNRLGDPQFL